MNRSLELTAAGVALLVTLIGGTVTIENRYAKAQEVKVQLNNLYAKQLKLRILELQLKPPPLSTSDNAMLMHLQQELRETSD